MSAIIKKLEVQGFKSFADRTKIVFHPGITAIVGPNGTGKSNLVDAMLWVMGGLRLKSLRGDRTEDVIFNGNAKKPAQGMADAVLSLAGDEEELAFSHRVFRSGESEYRINGKTVRLRDVQDELWKRGVGEKEYFVIEQGAIGNFVTSKPNEKRALIEEAAGTAYYKDKKKQAQSKLESTEINLTRLEDIIIEVEKAKNSLQRQAQAANRYRRLRERIRELTSHHYQRKLAQLEEAQKRAVELYDAGLAREREVSARVREEEKNLSAMRKALWDRETALKESKEKLFGTKSQLSRLESDVERETKRLEFFDEKKRRSETDRDELLEDVLHLARDLEEARAKTGELERTIEKNTAEVEEASRVLREAKDAAAAKEKTIEELRESYLRTLQDMTETRNESAKIEKEIELLARQEEKLALQIEENIRLLDENGTVVTSLEEAAAAQSAEKEAAAARLETIRESLASVRAAKSVIQGRLDGLRFERDETAHHLQALRKIEIKERDEGGAPEVPGELGLLADLIRTTPENALLLDTFWREESRARVVPAETFAEAIPEGLKGRYVLVASRPGPPLPDEIGRSPEFLGFLKSRFEADDAVKDRLVPLDKAVLVRDIRAAVRKWIDHPDWSFLTPSGDVLFSSGLLKLGEKAEGMMTLTAEIRELEETLARLDRAIAPLASDLDAKTGEETAAVGRDEHERAVLARAERALADTRKELQFVHAEREKIRTTLSILTKETENLRRDEGQLTASFERTSDGLQGRETQVLSFRERMEREESGLAEALVRNGELERGFHEKKARLDVLQERLSSLGHQLRTTERRKEAAESKISLLEADAGKSEEEKVALAENIQSLRDRIKSLEAERIAAETGSSEAEAELQTTRKNLDEAELLVQKTRDSEAEVRDERMKAEIRKAEVERDLLNLEETCWQELKKTIPELRAEWEARTRPEASRDAEGAAENQESGPAEEEIEEESEGASAEEEGETSSPEAPGAAEGSRPRRAGRKLRPVAEMTDEEVERELDEARESLNRYKAVNLMAEDEFLEQRQRFEFLTRQRQDLRESIRSTQEAINKIDEESKTQFLKAVEEVNTNFQEIFSTLFKGGNASVKLLEPENPLESGVEIVAQPPGKRVQNLSLLSGGEKSLTSLAFLFALFRTKPSPFCFLDEVDAALDDVNLARFLDLLRNIKHQTQFILVTHNYKTMEVADYIYGTTMEEPNITKVYSVKLEKKDVGIENSGNPVS